MPPTPPHLKMSDHTKFPFHAEFACLPSQSHRKTILSNRDYIVFLSCDHRLHGLGFATRRQYEGNTRLPEYFRKATRHRVALATPSNRHRIYEFRTQRHLDMKTILTKPFFSVSNISHGNVGIQILKNQHLHSLFLRSYKLRSTINSISPKITMYMYFEVKTIR